MSTEKEAAIFRYRNIYPGSTSISEKSKAKIDQIQLFQILLPLCGTIMVYLKNVPAEATFDPSYRPRFLHPSNPHLVVSKHILQ